MTTLTKFLGALGFLLSEAAGARSRAQIIIAESMDLIAGAVLGQKRFGDLTSSADAGNTGDGVLSGLLAGRRTEVGDYLLTCVAAAANGGTFSVVGPGGERLADAEVGTAYLNEHLGFTISDGNADFVVGDQFTVTVPEGSLEYVELDPDASDGSQVAAAVLGRAVTTGAGETANEVGVLSDAEVNANELTWPTGITSDEKSRAIADLKAAGVLVR